MSPALLPLVSAAPGTFSAASGGSCYCSHRLLQISIAGRPVQQLHQRVSALMPRRQGKSQTFHHLVHTGSSRWRTWFRNFHTRRYSDRYGAPSQPPSPACPKCRAKTGCSWGLRRNDTGAADPRVVRATGPGSDRLQSYHRQSWSLSRRWRL